MANYLTYNGETHNYSEWARLLGINKNTLYKRKRYGWEEDKIIGTKLSKPGKKGRKIKCVETGIIYDTVSECSNVLFIEPVNIRNNANGRTKKCRGLHFEWVIE